MITNRDIASLILIGVVLAAAVAWPPTRSIVRDLLGVVWSRFFLSFVALYTTWMTLVIAGAYQLGLWNADLLKDTVIWVATAGLLMVFRVNDATEPAFYWLQIRRIGLVGVALGIYLNWTALSIPGEIVLQLVIACTTFVVAFGSGKAQYAVVTRFGRRLQAVIGLAMVAFVALWLISNWRTLDPGSIALSLLLPVWLTALALPFVFVLSVLFRYQQALNHLDSIAEGRKAGWRVKLALVLGFRLHLRDMNSPGWAYDWKLSRAKSIREGLQIVGDHRRSLRNKESDERRAAQRLVDNAGVKGTDEDGRQLDQREFADTRNALQWIATCQMGWFRTLGGQYKPDLMKILTPDSSLKRLPADHGIHLTVAKNRHSWYAWRRTISGYCFAIGAAKAPPDQWLYDGPEPPQGFPGKDPTWGTAPFGPDAMNW